MSASGKARVTTPAPQRRLRSSERNRRGETDRVDCVRIVHWLRNALAHVQPKQRPAVVALLKTIFAQETAEAAREQWASVADALRERFPRLAELMLGKGRCARSRLIPTRADHHALDALAQSRRPMDMMIQGWSMRRFQASQQWSTMSR